MTVTQTIHESTNTITTYEQEYLITTEVTFSASGTYRCRAMLWKSNGGEATEAPLYKSQGRTSDEDEVEKVLQECVDSCSDKIDDIERAKMLDIDVRVK